MKFDKVAHFISLDSLVKHNPDANRHKRKSLHHESRKKELYKKVWNRSTQPYKTLLTI